MVEFFKPYWDWAAADESLYTLVLYAAFILGIILLLGKNPRTTREILLKGIEFAVCWCGMEALSGIYYALLGDSYLNQVQQVVFVLLYGGLRSQYPIAKRLVMGSAGWAAEILVVAISGFSGTQFGLPAVAVMAAAFGAVVWVLRRFAIEDFRLAPGYYVGGMIIMALFGVISSANWHIEPGFQPYYFVLSIVLLTMLLLFYVMFYAINRSYGRNLELLAQQASLEAQQRLLLLSQKSYEELRLLRHEIKNHDAYIETLVSGHQYEELEKYLQSQTGVFLETVQQFSCGNPIIDAVISQNMAVARIEGVAIEVRAAVPSKLSVKDHELFALLNNLLSNAIEASTTANVPAPVVRLELRQEREYLFLHMENPVDPAEAQERLKLHTTKKNRELHGYGTKVIRRIAESYAGCVQYEIRDQKFISDLMLAATEV